MTADSSVHVSPVGRLVFPNLNVASVYKDKPDSKPAYYTDLDIEGKEGQDFEAMILEYAKDYAKRVGRRSIDLENVIRIAKDKDTVLDDTIRFRFKVSNINTKRGLWDRKPAFYKADGSPYDPEPRIGAGTIAQVAFTFYEWKAATNGLTLQPEGILIHELHEGSSARAVDRSYQSLFGDRGAAAPKAAAGGADF